MMGSSDFDFMFGNWTVRHRKLATRLAGANDWYEFEGSSTTRPLMNGSGNIEDNFLDDPAGSYRACAFRDYDRNSGLWRIWWLDKRFPESIGQPVVGQFAGNTGVFEAADTWDGRDLLLRFTWTVDAGDGPRWEQAMSIDNGANWETNWVMDFRPA